MYWWRVVGPMIVCCISLFCVFIVFQRFGFCCCGIPWGTMCSYFDIYTDKQKRASKSVMCGPSMDRSKSSSRTIMNPVTSFFAVKTPDYCPLVKGDPLHCSSDMNSYVAGAGNIFLYWYRCALNLFQSNRSCQIDGTFPGWDCWFLYLFVCWKKSH